MRGSRTAILFLLLVVTVASLAQTRREDEPFCSEEGAAKTEITDADATVLGLTIGRASLEDVEAKLGKAKTTRVSREEESDISVCYVSTTDGTVLAFYSGAMGGWSDITSFALWSREAAFPHLSECKPSKLVSRSLATQSGMRLGLAKADLEQIAGKPTGHGSNSVKYEYVCRKKMTAGEIQGFKTRSGWDVTSDPYFDRMSWIEVHYRGPSASRIEIGEIDSY